MAKFNYVDAEGNKVPVLQVVTNNRGEPESLLIIGRDARKHWVHASEYKRVSVVDRIRRKQPKVVTTTTVLKKEQVLNKELDAPADTVVADGNPEIV